MMSKVKVLLSLSFLLFVFPAITLAQKASKNMVPVLNAISPSSTTAGGTSLTLTVAGSNFTSGSVVRWKGSSLTTMVVNSTTLQAVVASSSVASAGSANVTVYTSGRWGGTSNSLTFTIDAPPAAAPPPPPPPPPSPDPLAITTSSVPGGNAGNTYNTSLASSGGTPAITWSTASGGGALPPGLALQANGTLTGMPTQGGTFNFTAQASDQAGQVAQRAFSLSVTSPPPPPPPPGGYLFQNGFEPSDTPWNKGIVTETGCVANGSAEVMSASPAPRPHAPDSTPSLYGGHIHYVIGANECDANQDQNREFVQNFDSTNGYPNGVDPIFVRGYFRGHLNSGGADNNFLQRKLFYIKDSTGTWNLSVVLTSDGHYFRVQNAVTGGLGSNPCGADGPHSYSPLNCPGQYCISPPIWSWDTWNAVELGIGMNTPGLSDGWIKFWVNGTQYMNATGLNLRGTCSNTWRRIEVGVQANRSNFDPVDEERYWDDVVISTTGPIGP
jgi:hypothetical protein